MQRRTRQQPLFVPNCDANESIVMYISKRKMILLFGISVLLLNSVLRSSFFHVTGLRFPGHLSSVNLLAIFALFIVFVLYIRDIHITPLHTRVVFLLLSLAFVVLVTYSNYTGGTTMGHWVLFGSIVPGLLLYGFEFLDVDYKLMFTHLLKIFDVALTVLFCIGILDYLVLGGLVNNFIAGTLSEPGWAQMIRAEFDAYGYRMCTIIGAPLFNAFYALLYIMLNSIYERYYNRGIMNKWVVYTIGLVTIFLTGSRVALVVGISLALFSELTKRWGMLRVIVVIIGLIIVVNTPLFQNTIGVRLNNGFMNETDARYKLIVELANNRFGMPGIFSGGGYNYSRELTAMSIANSKTINFEYPFLMFAFDYGIVATVIYYILFFIIPEIELIVSGHRFAAFTYLLVFGSVQTFNMVAQFYDANLQLAFLMVLLSGIAKQLKADVEPIGRPSKLFRTKHQSITLPVNKHLDAQVTGTNMIEPDTMLDEFPTDIEYLSPSGELSNVSSIVPYEGIDSNYLDLSDSPVELFEPEAYQNNESTIERDFVWSQYQVSNEVIETAGINDGAGAAVVETLDQPIGLLEDVAADLDDPDSATDEKSQS